LLGLYDPFERLLDYTTGEATCSRDQPGTFERKGLDEAQDVVATSRYSRQSNGMESAPDDAVVRRHKEESVLVRGCLVEGFLNVIETGHGVGAISR
jgi:hypothetical protein